MVMPTWRIIVEAASPALRGAWAVADGRPAPSAAESWWCVFQREPLERILGPILAGWWHAKGDA
jgi:hypothetical protein